MAAISGTVVITGASSGIGGALARRYAQRGAVLALMGRNPARLDQVAEECRRIGATVHTAVHDVRDRLQMQQWLAEIDAGTPIDTLIANAGVMAGSASAAEIEPPAAGYELAEINILGVLNSVQPVLPWMMRRRRGQIGIVSSLAAFVPLADSPSYCASKSAVLMYGLALRAALHDCGIGVSVICPGYVRTPMLDQETGTKPLAIDCDAAAKVIMRGLQRNRSIIAFPYLFYLLTRFTGLLPIGIQRLTMPRFTVGPRIAPDA